MEKGEVKKRKMKGVILSDDEMKLFENRHFSKWVRTKIKESIEKGEFL